MVPPKVFVVRESVNAVVAAVLIVPLFDNVVPDALNVNVFDPITKVPPDAVVRVPLTLISPAAVFVKAVQFIFSVVYVPLAIAWPPTSER